MRLLALVLASLLLAACGGGSAGTGLTGTAAANVVPAAQGGSGSGNGGSGNGGGGTIASSGKIRHVIIVIMENRTMDNLFNGYPGADTVQTGQTHDGRTIPLQPSPFEQPCDPDHSHAAWVKDYDGGKMDGFDTTPANCGGLPASPTIPYGYVPRAEVQPYFDVAKQATLADRMFATQSGPSYPGHLFLIAGTSHKETDDPSDPLVWGCDAPAGTTVPLHDDQRPSQIVGSEFPCFDTTTLGDVLDQANRSWKYYTFLLDYRVTQQKTAAATLPYDAIRHIRFGPDWNNNIVGPGFRIFTDIQNGTLPDVSWVNPPIVATDHAQTTTNLGPDYVATLANTLAASKYWDDTALLVTWDDHGGWYDHVAPQQLDGDGLGFRVPLLVISKWAKHGYVSHTQHEFGSLLKFTERALGLPSLNTTDARADDLSDCFDFSQTPPSYANIATVHVGLNFFLQLGPDPGPSDY